MAHHEIIVIDFVIFEFLIIQDQMNQIKGVLDEIGIKLAGWLSSSKRVITWLTAM